MAAGTPPAKVKTVNDVAIFRQNFRILRSCGMGTPKAVRKDYGRHRLPCIFRNINDAIDPVPISLGILYLRFIRGIRFR